MIETSEKTAPITKRRFKRRKHPGILIVWCSLLIAVTGAGFSYTWIYVHPAVVKYVQPANSIPGFVPVVGDVHDPEDADPDITVEQPLVPGFQFQRGGFQLSGRVVDAQSGQPVINAIVWINMPAQKGRPTSIALHVVTDASGNYQFMHLAAGIYTVAASRYFNEGDGRFYAERIFSAVALSGNRFGLSLPLTPIPAPGKRPFVTGRAKNVILIDLRGFYANSLLNDTLLVNQAPNLRVFLRRAHVLQSVWHPYGWRPLDQYALLTGSYPQWATYDTWPKPIPWGAPDAIDTRFWFTGGRNAHLFGQESIFDVAKGYGMQTGVVAGADYILSDATTRNLDLLQRSSTFEADRWLAQMEDTVVSGMQQANGFLLYGELAPLAQEDMSSSPDAQGDEYQRALQLADQTFGQFIDWLDQQGALQNTLIALTTSQAQANHTDADNFYGMGATGQGTSKQTLLALSGPVTCAGLADNTAYASFVIAPVLMYALGLPAPAEARVPVPPREKGCL
jgi:carboxypeptidase family protein